MDSEEKKKVNTKINLCDTCKKSGAFPECHEKDDVAFGDGTGNDNIIKCKKYADFRYCVKPTAAQFAIAKCDGQLAALCRAHEKCCMRVASDRALYLWTQAGMRRVDKLLHEEVRKRKMELVRGQALQQAVVGLKDVVK